MSARSMKVTSVHGATLTRRGLLRTGGALVVSVGLLPAGIANAEEAVSAATSLDVSAPQSWVEIHADNSVVIRTGKCDFGQGSIYTAYPQIIADELGVAFDVITTISGDTDRTPDGGGTFGLLRTNVLNLRKVAAYTREAILALAAERFGVEKDQLSVENGVVSGGGQSATYGELVDGQDLNLTVAVSGSLDDIRGLVVEGDPPLMPASRYSVIGQSIKNPLIAEKVAAKTTWVADVKLPDMLHGRVVHPATLGSTLVSVGDVDAERYPTARTVVVGNLVGVVAESEWEAVQAARDVAFTTEWSEWEGLPGHENLQSYLRDGADWDIVPPNDGRSNAGDAAAALENAAHLHTASYEMPFHKHAPIGPTMALADVREDGLVTVHTHSQNPQNLRMQIAMTLETSPEKVVIRTYPGPGHYGRSNGGNAGAEDEAALLSRAVGRPVRLQWMRADDLQWSTQSAAGYSDIDIALDEDGKISGYRADHYGPPMQDDRTVGALLAGLPTIKGPVPDNDVPVQGMANGVFDGWIYGEVANVAETAHSTWQVGQRESPLDIGLRDHSMRTPTQFQQNFPREVAITEAAALAGVDALQFRIDNTDDRRLKRILEMLREETDWEARPSPKPDAIASGEAPQSGRGVSAMFRGNGYWACACEVTVTPSSGELQVNKLTMVVDVGVVVNPDQLVRQVEAGSLMGVSQALFEEVTFDKGAITIQDWISYPILTMGDMPEVKVVLAPDPDTDIYGQGSEGANGLVPSAIATALYDATGKPARRLPLRPETVKAMLSA